MQDLTVEDRVSRTQFQYTIEDPDSVELATWTDKIVDAFRKLPELQHVVTDQAPDGNSLALNIDRMTASRLGITPQSLDDTLYDAFGQRQVTTLYTQTNQYHVILEAMPQFQHSPKGLSSNYLQGGSSSSLSSSSGGGGAAAVAPPVRLGLRSLPLRPLPVSAPSPPAAPASRRPHRPPSSRARQTPHLSRTGLAAPCCRPHRLPRPHRSPARIRPALPALPALPVVSAAILRQPAAVVAALRREAHPLPGIGSQDPLRKGDDTNAPVFSALD